MPWDLLFQAAVLSGLMDFHLEQDGKNAGVHIRICNRTGEVDYIIIS